MLVLLIGWNYFCSSSGLARIIFSVCPNCLEIFFSSTCLARLSIVFTVFLISWNYLCSSKLLAKTIFAVVLYGRKYLCSSSSLTGIICSIIPVCMESLVQIT